MQDIIDTVSRTLDSSVLDENTEKASFNYLIDLGRFAQSMRCCDTNDCCASVTVLVESLVHLMYAFDCSQDYENSIVSTVKSNIKNNNYMVSNDSNVLMISQLYEYAYYLTRIPNLESVDKVDVSTFIFSVCNSLSWINQLLNNKKE